MISLVASYGADSGSGSRRRAWICGEPFRLSIEEWAPDYKIVYDRFHIVQHANDAIDEVRKAEFFRQGKEKREVIKGKKWLLLSRWESLTGAPRGELIRLFQLNRRVFKAYLLRRAWSDCGIIATKEPCSTI